MAPRPLSIDVERLAAEAVPPEDPELSYLVVGRPIQTRRERPRPLDIQRVCVDAVRERLRVQPEIWVRHDRAGDAPVPRQWGRSHGGGSSRLAKRRELAEELRVGRDVGVPAGAAAGQEAGDPIPVAGVLRGHGRRRARRLVRAPPPGRARQHEVRDAAEPALVPPGNVEALDEGLVADEQRAAESFGCGSCAAAGQQKE